LAECPALNTYIGRKAFVWHKRLLSFFTKTSTLICGNNRTFKNTPKNLNFLVKYLNFLLDENSRYIYNKKYGKTKALVLFYNALMGKKEMEEL